MKKLRQLLQLLIDKAVELGLPDADVIHAGDYLEHQEYTQCLNHVAGQLYHFGIRIDSECYDIVIEVSDILHIPQTEYQYLKEILH